MRRLVALVFAGTALTLALGVFAADTLCHGREQRASPLGVAAAPERCVPGFGAYSTLVLAGTLVGFVGVWLELRAVALAVGVVWIGLGALLILSIGIYVLLTGLLMLAGGLSLRTPVGS